MTNNSDLLALFPPCAACGLPLSLDPEQGVHRDSEGRLQHAGRWCRGPARLTGREGLRAILDLHVPRS